ncbi:glycosyl transferase [Sphingobium sp. C100]|uniref:glycosyltransferase n=1 Tax=Sphingobium sp. C100 TaxID=1207055 RepID=UPI0003D5A939|nr:glycosyltransferase [Sphingobium sp. C100]ETI65296.1 glycosyl transferase [Sphingobium sp. C100]
MRILTFLHSFEPGGVERIALRLILRWRSQGVDAPLFMGRASGAMAAEFGDRLDYVMPAPPFPVGWCETLWMIATLPATIRRTRPDILFCAGNSYAVVVVAMKILLGRQCPPVVAKISNDLDRRDMIWPVRRIYHLWLRIQGRFIDHFVGMEGPMEAEIVAAIRPDPHAISIIPDPALSRGQIDRLRALPRPQRGKGCRFVSIGRLARQKNFPLMIRAFARGARPADTLTIYGEGRERPVLEALIAKLGLGGRIMLPGHVPDPASRLTDFDLFLLSSDYEGVPAVLLEALAAGLPVITTQSSRSIGAMMGDGKLACIVAVGDEAGFGTALGQADAIRQDDAASLRQARRFTIEDAADAYLVTFAATVHAPEAYGKIIALN